jgi:integrase
MQKRAAPRPPNYPPEAPWPLPPGIFWRPYGSDGGHRFEIYAQVAGKRKYVGVCRTWREVKPMLDAFAATMAVAKHEGTIAAETGLGRRRLLRDAWATYLATRMLDTEFVSGPSYADRFRLHVLNAPVGDDGGPTLGNRYISQITRGHLVAWRDALRKKATHRGNKLLAPSTVSDVQKILGAAFAYFVRSGWLNANPMLSLDRLKVPKRPKTIIKTREAMTEFLRCCDAVDCLELAEIVIILLSTGMRISELLYLRWEGRDGTGVFLDHMHKGRALPFLRFYGKGNKLREVPVLDVVQPILARRYAERGDHPLVFPGSPLRRKKEGDERKRINPRERHEPLPPGVYARNPEAVLRGFKKAIRLYNTRNPDAPPLSENMRVHDTRHTFGSHWVNDGRSLDRLSILMGHSGSKITRETYVEPEIRAYADDLDAMPFEVPALKQKQLPAGT